MPDSSPHVTDAQRNERSLQIRTFASPDVTEWYINARPAITSADGAPGHSLYKSIVKLLNAHGARILSERIFVTEQSLASVLADRGNVLGALDDGVPPTVLEIPEASDSANCQPQLQIHAVRHRSARPQPVEDEGALVGRRLEMAGRTWLYLEGATSFQASGPAAHARHAFEQADRVLKRHDMDFRCVARTWLWLRDILSWYDELNAVRNEVFAREGLIGASHRARFLPASTGIGVSPAGNGACGLELIAISDGRESIRSSESVREQCSAFSYGSAFSRAVIAPVPAGEALFVSGTAAIDNSGASEHPGHVGKQIHATIQHIRSLVTEAGWSEEQLASAVAYSKTEEVGHAFATEWASLDWPRVEVIGDVCRDELLFEMEVTFVRPIDPGIEPTS